MGKSRLTKMKGSILIKSKIDYPPYPLYNGVCRFLKDTAHTSMVVRFRCDPRPKLGGANTMGKYELMFILSADLDDASRKAEIEKLHKILTDNKGVVRDSKEMGVREFASPIHDLKKGFYVVEKISADNACLEEFKRLVRLDNLVIRFLITVDKD